MRTRVCLHPFVDMAVSDTGAANTSTHTSSKIASGHAVLSVSNPHHCHAKMSSFKYRRLGVCIFQFTVQLAYRVALMTDGPEVD